MRNFDFSSWESVLTTIVGLALFTLIGIGIRLLMMVTIQQRQQRMNRQINERLRTLISAYKVLGGSLTGTLTVNPAHKRDLRRTLETAAAADATDAPARPGGEQAAERARQIRDAVEAALSDIFLLGTEEQVRLAQKAAVDLVAGREVATQELVVSLRKFIRKALDLDAIPADLDMPLQGPTRPGSSGGRGGRPEGRGGGQGGGGGMGGGMGMGMGGGMGGVGDDATTPPRR